MKLEEIRREYLQNGLSKKDLDADPVQQFNLWLQNAIEAELVDPTAMSIATVDQNGQPSQRIVLLKHNDEKGFVFYTNLESQKAQDIDHNDKVSLHFSWLSLERQVRILGHAQKLSALESFHYFSTRPKESQLAAWASQQSHPISSRELLEQQFARMKQKFFNKEIPLPSFWGGYRVEPHHFEFWQGRGHRLHDRLVYQKQDENQWKIMRLAP